MRRPLLALVLAIAAIGVFTAGLAALLDTPRPPRGASRGERLYYGLCVTCHGPDGRGSWRASLFLIRPGNLADAARLDQRSDQYLVDIIKNGGAPRSEEYTSELQSQHELVCRLLLEKKNTRSSTSRPRWDGCAATSSTT